MKDSPEGRVYSHTFRDSVDSVRDNPALCLSISNPPSIFEENPHFIFELTLPDSHFGFKLLYLTAPSR
jgi:hypothetical protein